ncbi:hypothetical protein H696_02568 [Fonticula alba]|uniref:Uncharacterized protein n=1 Tax=Fonticula alba TaxID=691883 RepID=A0A058Z8I7_FONAL|nr:hypothetical protein H696_02568 [Fonticula alba]KCV70238.1 hypothetical protein H696_02568 [Fonticula alba]|eukprot:XP_009494754.1 hypothetical protein H696_02568 [Fonticula alba]
MSLSRAHSSPRGRDTPGAAAPAAVLAPSAARALSRAPSAPSAPAPATTGATLPPSLGHASPAMDSPSAGASRASPSARILERRRNEQRASGREDAATAPRSRTASVSASPVASSPNVGREMPRAGGAASNGTRSASSVSAIAGKDRTAAQLIDGMAALELAAEGPDRDRVSSPGAGGGGSSGMPAYVNGFGSYSTNSLPFQPSPNTGGNRSPASGQCMIASAGGEASEQILDPELIQLRNVFRNVAVVLARHVHGVRVAAAATAGEAVPAGGERPPDLGNLDIVRRKLAEALVATYGRLEQELILRASTRRQQAREGEGGTPPHGSGASGGPSADQLADLTTTDESGDLVETESIVSTRGSRRRTGSASLEADINVVRDLDRLAYGLLGLTNAVSILQSFHRLVWWPTGGESHPGARSAGGNMMTAPSPRTAQSKAMKVAKARRLAHSAKVHGVLGVLEQWLHGVACVGAVRKFPPRKDLLVPNILLVPLETLLPEYMESSDLAGGAGHVRSAESPSSASATSPLGSGGEGLFLSGGDRALLCRCERRQRRRVVGPAVADSMFREQGLSEEFIDRENEDWPKHPTRQARRLQRDSARVIAAMSREVLSRYMAGSPTTPGGNAGGSTGPSPGGSLAASPMHAGPEGSAALTPVGHGMYKASAMDFLPMFAHSRTPSGNGSSTAPSPVDAQGAPGPLASPAFSFTASPTINDFPKFGRVLSGGYFDLPPGGGAAPGQGASGGAGLLPGGGPPSHYDDSSECSDVGSLDDGGGALDTHYSGSLEDTQSIKGQWDDQVDSMV